MESNEKKKMAGDAVNSVISALALMICTMLTGLIQNGFLKMLFILSYMISIATFHIYFRQGDKNKKRMSAIFAVFSAMILFTSNYINKVSLEDCLLQAVSFVRAEKKEEENINENLENMEIQIDSLKHDRKLHDLAKSREDQEEIKNLSEKIKNERERYRNEHEDDCFSNLETDRKEVELFYKMYLSNTDCYYYYNTIKAFESLGIDCEQLEIDEHLLALWDTEHLLSIYNMRKSLEDEDRDKKYEMMELMYQEYKAKDLDQYDDSLDYMNWRKWYENVTVQEAMGYLDEQIVKCYKKLYLNFHTES